MDAFSNLLAWWPVAVSDVGEIGGVSFGAHSASGDPTELMRVSITATGPNPEMQMQDDQAIDIALSDGKSSISFDELSVLYGCVESILDWFRPRFAL